MTLFGSLRRTTQDQKDHSSDDDDDNDVQLTPLLADPTTHPSNNTNSTVDSLSDSFTLRIKLNNGKSTIDYTLNNISQNITVSTLKESILKKHFAASSESNNSNNRYLRLIVRGRMMAPDTSHLDKFSISNNDVIHAVLAKEGARGGQQALMLRRINNNTNSVNNSTNSNNIGSGGRSGGANTSNASARQSPWRRIGIDQNGVVIPRPNDNDEESDDDTSEDDFEDANGEIDLEGQLEPPQRRRRRRERRGFDRLRATGMTRAEVTAIRLYFARSVDRYIERRRVMIRASQRLRNSLNEIDNTTNNSTTSSPSRARSNTGGSANSLLDVDLEDPNVNNAVAEGSESNANADNSNNNGSTAANNNAETTSATSTNIEGEEILNDRLRMEDEWMSTQGPYSEFRMNLNTSNPLLLAAISGGGAAGAVPGNQMPATTGGGMFFRSRMSGSALDRALRAEDDEEEMFGGTFTSNGSFIRNTGDNGGFPHPFLGPVPPAGTDKDFVWGFILGFFVGFIMLFWVWMPTVPHKQKIGIISGISFQLGLNLLRKGGENGVF